MEQVTPGVDRPDDTAAAVRVRALVRTVASARSSEELARSALPEVAALVAARAAAVVRRSAAGWTVVAGCGIGEEDLGLVEAVTPLLEDLVAAPAGTAGHVGEVGGAAGAGGWAPVPVPEALTGTGISTLGVRVLPSPGEVLLLAWDGDGSADPWGEAALDLVVGGLGRHAAQDALTDLTERVDNAQILANMGDYDWHIASDTNRWSDQLYRIYGHEPQSFNASYEKFLAHIHPDDRERIQGVHQQAYATGEPYQMIERVVRPTGEVRYLSSNGQVVMGPDGAPQRMRGTCIDVTDRMLAEADREHSAARFRSLVESSPDAIVVLDAEGVVVEANGRAEHLLGGDPVGRRTDEVLAEPVTGSASAAVARGLDGRDLRLDVVTAELHGSASGSENALFLRDALPRLANEALTASLHEARARRRQALEINDNVVQGLTSALYAAEQGEHDSATYYLGRTLEAARAMMTDLLGPHEERELSAGDLRRTRAAALSGTAPSLLDEPATVASAHEGGNDAVATPVETRRVLVADDSEDIRMLLRLKMRGVDDCEVVGEAGDGEEAVRLASALQPHLVLLDLAMPRMDGLEALPLIREAVDGVKVVVLSGFDEGTAAQRALSAGASRYLEKGRSMREIVDVVRELLDAPAG